MGTYLINQQDIIPMERHPKLVMTYPVMSTEVNKVKTQSSYMFYKSIFCSPGSCLPGHPGNHSLAKLQTDSGSGLSEWMTCLWR